MTTMLINPRDPLLLRDAREFSAFPGARAFTLPWPLPRTVAGALRTHIGNHAAPQPFDWHKRGPEFARKITVHGPLLVARRSDDDVWTPHVSAPRDFVAMMSDDAHACMALRPWQDDLPGKCDLPDSPAGLKPLRVARSGKPNTSTPAFWSLECVMRWLTTIDDTIDTWPVDGIPALPTELRTHVSMDAERGTGAEGMLFGVESIVFPDTSFERSALLPILDPANASASPPQVAILSSLATTTTWMEPSTPALPVGGERRIASITQDGSPWPAAKEYLHPGKIDWRDVHGIRLLLVTPAIFDHGWRPAWTVPPECDLGGAHLELVSAAVDRPIAVSGWDLERKRGMATRFAARAGSVFFFRVSDGASIEAVFQNLVNQVWLKPVSDNEQDRRDGFGLVLPGIW